MIALSLIMSIKVISYPVIANAQSDSNSEKEVIRLTASGQGFSDRALQKITDSDFYTFSRITKGSGLSFQASAPVKTLYFIFERPCEWILTLDNGTVIQGGEKGFLHETVVLPREVREFRFNASSDLYLCDVYAFADGILPDWVQLWQPPCEEADLMVMPTHSDDELLWFGGVLPYYAGELGYRVQVVYLTNHNLAPFRHHEMLNALWTVGVRNYPVQSEKFTDTLSSMGSMEKAANVFGRNRVLEFQVEMLRRFAPKVIVAHDINGEYGHGAHKLNAATLLDALKIYEDPSIFPESAEKYGIHRVQKCYLHLWSENTIFVDWNNIVLSKFGGRTAMEMAETGYLCHKSQQDAYSVAKSGRYDCRKFGLAYTTVGPDTPEKNDMFEHVEFPEKSELPTDSSLSEAAVSQTDNSPTAARPAAKKVTKPPVIMISIFVLSGGVILFIIFKSSLTRYRKTRRDN